MKVLLQGYYGFGNLGDDLLLCITYNYLKSHFPQSQITVFSNAPSDTHSYLKNMLSEDIRIIDYKFRDHFDLILHGGGGVHYDFKKGPLIYVLVNFAIRLLGYKNYLKIHSLYKRIKNREQITGTKRIGIGIGIGTFTLSSRIFSSNIILLAGYDTLFARDRSSFKKAGEYLRKEQVKLATDLAFCSKYWGVTFPEKESVPKKNIGIVLRNWEAETAHYKDIEVLSRELRERGFGITFFLFEKCYDNPVSEYFQERTSFRVWDPDKESVAGFLEDFNRQDIILTSRFHGAIIASALGIPSIAIGIEPKLTTLKEMLPSVEVIELPIDVNNLISLILERFENLTDYHKKVKTEYESRQNEIREALDLLTKLIQ